jgi:hypothetical protein
VEAEAVLKILGKATLQDLARALAPLDRFKLYELGWRMIRCAVSDDDIFIAAAAVALSPHPEQAQNIVSGYFPGMALAERVRRVTEADQRLRELARLFTKPIEDPPQTERQQLSYTDWVYRGSGSEMTV